MIKKALRPSEYNSYYKRYVDMVSNETELMNGLEKDKKMVIDFFSTLPKEKLEYRYQPEKWTIKEVLLHIIDTERIFMHRLFRIARKDTTPLPGYDQDNYVNPSEANSKTLEELIREFTVTRLYSINLINSISQDNLKNMGTVSESPMSARACAFLLLGHSIWHIEVIKKRYL